ncbi:MAG: hypothetical protein ACYTGC_16985 [Planctomycetota bacterium]
MRCLQARLTEVVVLVVAMRGGAASGLCAAILAGIGCQSFESAWQEMVDRDRTDARDRVIGMEGCWLGWWRSDDKVHGGQIWCVITSIDDSTVNARFKGLWMPGNLVEEMLIAGYGIIEFSVELKVSREGGVYKFTGEEYRFPVWYHHEGRVSGRSYTSTYSSLVDEGTILMTREH